MGSVRVMSVAWTRVRLFLCVGVDWKRTAVGRCPSPTSVASDTLFSRRFETVEMKYVHVFGNIAIMVSIAENRLVDTMVWGK